MLGWEELPKDERPPRRMWDDDKALVVHFERVEQDRERKYGGSGSGPIDDPVDNPAASSLIVE